MTETQESAKAELSLKVREIIADLWELPVDYVWTVHGLSGRNFCMRLASRLEKEFQLEPLAIWTREVMECDTVGDVIELVESKVECES